jgi:hypothetical protein
MSWTAVRVSLSNWAVEDRTLGTARRICSHRARSWWQETVKSMSARLSGKQNSFTHLARKFLLREKEDSALLFHSVAPAANQTCVTKHDPRASHEVRVTRSNTNNISRQFVSLVRVVSWIDLFTQKICSRKQELTVCFTEFSRPVGKRRESKSITASAGRCT